MKKTQFVYAVHSRYFIAYGHDVVSDENMIISIGSRLTHVAPVGFNISLTYILNLELGFTQYKYVGLYTYYSRPPVENSRGKI